ncbi:MAG TPA: gamma-glutamyl-gamma-aminobutyrate hydrolase family protein [Polyangia bacterium]|nr:gamma-glutamyl-gamma-aminobutyrate hydrolase family protein [Polyangia bacterium]
MTRPRLLLLKCGAAPREMAARCGDYQDWFSQGLRGVPWDLVEPYQGAFQKPDLAAYAGVLISGSPRSVSRPEPWMEEVADLVRAAHRRGTPVLGVCFGHQLIAWAFGGRVIRNPRGWELGTVDVEMTSDGRADPLFRGLGGPKGCLRVNETHEDAVDELSLPAGMRVLAQNAQTPVQALAYGDHVRGVQFHPEVTAAAAREYCVRRADQVGLERAHALAQAATDTPDGERVLANFVDCFVARS